MTICKVEISDKTGVKQDNSIINQERKTEGVDIGQFQDQNQGPCLGKY